MISRAVAEEAISLDEIDGKQTVLSKYDSSALIRLAEGRGIELPQYLPRAQLEEVVSTIIFEPGSVMAALSRLSSREGTALGSLVQHHPVEVEAALAVMEDSVTKPHSVLLRLVGLGLVLAQPLTDSGTVRFQALSGIRLWVPTMVADFIQTMDGFTAPFRLSSISADEVQEGDQPLSGGVLQGQRGKFLQNLLGSIKFYRQEPSAFEKVEAVSKGPKIPIRETDPSGSVAVPPIDDPLFRTILKNLGILSPPPAFSHIATSHVVSHSAAMAFVTASPHERVRLLFRAGQWGEVGLQELPGLGSKRCVTPKADVPVEKRIEAVRQIVHCLGLCCSSGWTGMADFVHFVFGRYPDFLYPWPAPWGPSHYPELLWDRGNGLSRVPAGAGRDLVEGGFIRYVLAQLEWAGMVQLALAGDEPVFRLTPEGVFAIGPGRKPCDEVEGEAGGAFVVQPTFEVVAFPEKLCLADAYLLDLVAESQQAHPAPTYKLVHDRLYRAISEGVGMDEIITFLQNRSLMSIPQNVLFTLEDWRDRFERLILFPQATVIEFDTEEEVMEVHQNSYLCSKEHLWVSDRILVIASCDDKDIARCVGQNVSCFIDYQSASPSPSLIIHDDLRVEVDRCRHSFLAQALLEKVAEHQESSRCHAEDGVGALGGQHANGGWRITVSSLGRAIAAGMDPTVLKKELARLCSRDLPAQFLLALQAACGEEPGMAITPVTLITTAESEVMDRLVSSPFADSFLLARVGPNAAVVKSKELNRLKAIFDEIGVPVGDQLQGLDVWGDLASFGAHGGEGCGRGSQYAGSNPDKMSSALVQRLLKEALARNEEIQLVYDPGSRRQLEQVWVLPLSLEEGLAATYLTAKERGCERYRRFSLNFIHKVRFS